MRRVPVEEAVRLCANKMTLVYQSDLALSRMGRFDEGSLRSLLEDGYLVISLTGRSGEGRLQAVAVRLLGGEAEVRELTLDDVYVHPRPQRRGAVDEVMLLSEWAGV